MDKKPDLMNDYGTKYNGKEILEFAEKGEIDAKEPINMLIFKSLYAQDKNSNDYVKPVSYKELLDFYSPEKHPGRIHSLLTSDKIDKNFSDLHTELLENVSKKDRENYIDDVISETKKLASVPEDFSNDLLNYVDKNIIPTSSLSGNITPEFLKKKFKAGDISIAKIISIYESDKEYFKGLESLLTAAEIEKAHQNNELEDSALMYLSDNARASYLQKNNVNLSTLMYLYLHCDGISVVQLQKIFVANNILDSLDSYIDVGSSPAKIKELYENYLIDYGCIKELVENGILTEQDIQKYKLGISKKQFYDDISSSNTINITGSAHNVPISTTGAFIGALATTKETMAKSTEVYKILGNISDQEAINIPVIIHKDERNEKGFLDGYKVLPLEPANLVAFLPPEPTKSMYLMPYQETAFILKNKTLPDSLLRSSVFQEIKASDKMHEEILRLAYQFEEAKSYLERLGYSEEYSYEEAMRIMTEEYMKIKIKGEN